MTTALTHDALAAASTISVEPPLKPTEQTLIGVRLNPDVDRSYGLMAYEILDDPQVILDDPDIRIFPTVEAAEKFIRKGARAPLGTTRVVKLNEIPYEARNRLPVHFRWGSSTTIAGRHVPIRERFFVTTIPMMDGCDPKQALYLLKTFESLPVLRWPRRTADGTTYSVESFVQDEPLLAKRSKSSFWGLPTLGLRKTTKLGHKPKSPAETIAKNRAGWLKARNALHPDLFQTFISELNSALLIPLSLTPSRTDYGSSTASLNLGSIASYYRFHTHQRSDWTWLDILQNSAYIAERLADQINDLLTASAFLSTNRPFPRIAANSRHPHHIRLNDDGTEIVPRKEPEAYDFGRTNAHKSDDTNKRGVLRDIFVLLRRLRSTEIHDALALFAPVIAQLKTMPPADRRLSDRERHALRLAFLALHEALYRLTRAMGFRTYPQSRSTPYTGALYEQ